MREHQRRGPSWGWALILVAVGGLLVALYFAPRGLSPRAVIGGFPGGVNSLVLSGDGKVFVAGCGDGTIQFLDPVTGSSRGQLIIGSSVIVGSVTCSSDGHTLALAHHVPGTDTTVELWDLDTGSERADFRRYIKGKTLALSPDGKLLATVYRDINTIQLWDVTAASKLAEFEGHPLSVTGLAFSPDGKTLASCSQDCTVKLWDVEAKTLRSVISLPPHVESVAYSPDGRVIAAGCYDGTVTLWDVTDARERLVFQGHCPRSVYRLAFSPDGTLLASGDAYGLVHVWDVATGAIRLTLPYHDGPISGLVFSADGLTLATSNGAMSYRTFMTVPSEIRIWDVSKVVKAGRTK